MEQKEEKFILSIVKTEDGLRIEFNMFWKKGTWKDLFNALRVDLFGLSKIVTQAIPIEIKKEGEKGEDSEPEQPILPPILP